MKQFFCIILSFLMLIGTSVYSSAETISDIPDEYSSETKEEAVSPFKDINNISLTFYIINGKAYVSYLVSAKTKGITVNVSLKKETFGIIWVNAGEEHTNHSDKNYISGSYSAPVNDNGTYCINLEMKVNGETAITSAVYEYDKTKIYGDAVNDGIIRADDARLILRYSARLERYTEMQKIMCDIDNNGTITAADARIVLRLAAKLI